MHHCVYGYYVIYIYNIVYKICKYSRVVDGAYEFWFLLVNWNVASMRYIYTNIQCIYYQDLSGINLARNL